MKSANPNNLPLQISSFIGREREIAEVRRLLSSARLVTLTGAGGCGKTRLSLAVAGGVIAEFDDGVWLVELAALNDPALVPQAVATALGLRERTSGTLHQALADYLHARHALLVLDNCEHLINACAMLSDALLQYCPTLQILATSRESLNVAGEIAWPVPSLTLPASDQVDEPDALVAHEAIRLFCERARAVVPHFALTRENASAVVEVCRQLDGIPLAIELAAVRVKVLGVEQIAARLDDRLDLLTGGIRTALPRQHTLRATMDWSYELLSGQERVLLQRLSVFRGGWTLEAAEAVCGSQNPIAGSQNPLTSSQVADNHQAANLTTVYASAQSRRDDWLMTTDILDLLTHLVDKSLVMLDTQTGDPRRLRRLRSSVVLEFGDHPKYRMLETIRQYAEEKLRDAAASEQIRIRHLEYFLRWVEQAEPKLIGPEQLAWLQRLDRERDNLRHALEWSLGPTADAAIMQMGFRLAAILWRYWLIRGELVEGRRWSELALARSEPLGRSLVQAQLLNAAGCLGWLQGDFAIAQAWLEQSAEIARAMGAKREQGYALDWLALIVAEQGNFDLSAQLATQSIALFHEVQDLWGEAHGLFSLARGWLRAGADATARPYYDESLKLFQSVGDMWGSGMVIGHLGMIAEHQGDYATARDLMEQRLALAREIGSQQLISVGLYHLGMIAYHLEEHARAAELLKESLTVSERIGLGHSDSLIAGFSGLGIVAAAAGQSARAARLFAAAEALGEKMGAQRAPAEQAQQRRGMARVRASLSREAFRSAWAQGHAMPLKQAIAYALETTVEQEPPRTARQAEKRRYGGLTPRERQVATLVAQGKSNREIAAALVLSERTITTHVANVLSKLGFSSRTQIAAWAVEIGLV
jgi:non-specific serine/threonine protein kinase